MIRPLFFRSPAAPDKVPLGIKLFRIIVRWFLNLGPALGRLFSRLGGGDGSVRMGRLDGGRIDSMAADLLAAYSPAKKRDMRGSVTLFARLIVWGTEPRGVSWKPSAAPGEDCARLSNAVSSGAAPAEDGADAGTLAPAILRCGELFEEAIYSPRILSKEERLEFKELIEKICS
jgi:hypothetical protein